jgi:Flp pilus assembly protein TadD
MALLLTILAVISSSGTQLEISGDFVSAGRAYQEDRDAAGQVRIISRYIEEALYSGSSIHALELIMQLEELPLQDGCVDFWYARLAWSCGLSEYSLELLENLQAEPWLASRALGIAAQFRGDPEQAVEELIISLQQARTVRESFYSALDLSFALTQSGRYGEAEVVARFLSNSFPGEGLPLASLALSMQGQERFGEAMSVLQTLYTNPDYSYICQDMARALMEDLE